MKNILRNFLIAVRSYFLSSILNVLGLALALFTAIVISIQANWEYSFDRGTPNSERIYRLTYGNLDMMPMPMLDLAINSSSHIEAYAINGIWDDQTLLVSGDGENFVKQATQAVSPALLQKMITPAIVEGSYASLDDPNSVVLSRQTAIKIYGSDKGVVGRTLTVKGSEEIVRYNVGAVYEDMPSNSIFRNSIYRKFTDQYGNATQWSNYCTCLYVMLNSKSNEQAVKDELSKIKIGKDVALMSITPIRDLYFSEFSFINVPRGNKTTTNVMILVAILIMIVAAINFINFSFALAPRRVKSVSIHRIFGSSVAAIRASVVGETMIFAAIAYLLALAIMQLFEPLIRDMISTPATIAHNVEVVVAMFIVALGVGAIAGSCSAYYLSRESRRLRSSSHRSGWLRSLLLGFQYTVSAALIVVALVMNSQIDFLKNRNLGYQTDNVLLFEISPQVAQSQIAQVEEVLGSIPQIRSVAFCSDKFGVVDIVGGLGRQVKGQQVQFNVVGVSYNFPQVIGLSVVEGRGFNQSDLSERSGSTYRLLFNSNAAKLGGFHASDTIDNEGSLIVGVTNDYNFNSLKEPLGQIAMMCFVRGEEWMPLTWVYCKYEGDRDAAEQAIRRAMLTIDKGTPVVVEQLVELSDMRYMKDNNQTSIISFFSLLSILISLSGVVSLVLIDVRSRAREIALRKVHGAQLLDVLMIVNRKFLITSLVASLLSIPVAYYFSMWWLENFAYRIDVSWTYFAAGTVSVIVVTAVIVTACCHHVVVSNPLKYLKNNS